MAYTECLKCAASEANATALTAPAEVPVMMGKGHAEPLRNNSATPFSTPTWYAERAPPPVNTSPSWEAMAGMTAVCHCPVELSEPDLLGVSNSLTSAKDAAAGIACACYPGNISTNPSLSWT